MQAEKTKRKKRHIISKFLKTIDEEKKILSSNKKKVFYTQKNKNKNDSSRLLFRNNANQMVTE